MTITMQDILADGETATAIKVKVQRPKRFAVIFYNDDFTPMEFVVLVLGKYFNKGEEESIAIMLKVHHEGRALVGLYTREIAEQKVHEVMEHAKVNGFPLRVASEEHSE